MNFGEILNYKTHCPICSDRLLIDCKTFKSRLYLEKDAVLLKAKSNEVRLYFDNRFESSVKLFHKNLKFARQCSNCIKHPKIQENNIYYNTKYIIRSSYYYSFNIVLKGNIIEPYLMSEQIYYSGADNKYGIDIDFVNNKTSLILADVEDTLKVTYKTFDKIIDMSKSKELEDINRKIEIIKLFL